MRALKHLAFAVHAVTNIIGEWILLLGIVIHSFSSLFYDEEICEQWKATLAKLRGRPICR